MQKINTQEEPKKVYLIEVTLDQLKTLVARIEHSMNTSKHGQDVTAPLTDSISFFLKGTTPLSTSTDIRSLMSTIPTDEPSSISEQTH